MKEINIRNLYPHITEDRFVTISEEVAEAIHEFEKLERNYVRALFRNKAQYSLDRDDGIDQEVLLNVPSPEDIYIQQETAHAVSKAVMRLPKRTRRRIYYHFYCGLAPDVIAAYEGVDVSCVHKSIRNGIKLMRNDTTFVEQSL